LNGEGFPILLFLLCSVAAFAQDGPPSLMWVVEPPDWIHEVQHIIPAQGGGYIAAAVPSTAHKPIIRFDETGNVLWEAGYCGIGFAYWVEQLPDGSIVATGWGTDPEQTISGLWITKVTSSGAPIWYKIYWLASGSSRLSVEGRCITELPDGGFAICGHVQDDNAWLLRTDAQGDTLWTRVWDNGGHERARRVIYHDSGLTVYVSDYGGHPWLLRYSMGGDLEWVVDYSAFSLLSYIGGSMCLAPDGGYALATAMYSSLVHTDWSGQEEWREEITGSSRRLGLSLDPTMDGGYIFSGWGDYWEGPLGSVEMHSACVDTGLHQDGWLVKLDGLGQTQWAIYNSQGSRQNYFNCARQLSQGGYIVAGQIWDHVHSDWNGYLLRYAPETGIESDPDRQEQGLSLSPSCNPFSYSVTVTCQGPSLPGQLMVYDITGRLIRSLSDRQGSSFLWDGRDASGAEAPTGTYLIQGALDGQVSSLRVVKL
jgi:hypothetical protein